MRGLLVKILLLLLILVVGVWIGRYAPDAYPGSPPTVDWDFWAVIVSLVTLVLAALAILIAVASVWVVIWGKPWIENLVRQEADRAAEAMRKELMGSLLGYVGYIFGRLRDVPGQLREHDLLTTAIKHSQDAYEILPSTSDRRINAVNNLAFYYSIRGYESDAVQAVQFAKILLEDYGKSRRLDCLTTYAAVVAKYFDHFDRPKQTLIEAERMMEELQARDDVTPSHKQSAARHTENLRAALQRLGGG